MFFYIIEHLSESYDLVRDRVFKHLLLFVAVGVELSISTVFKFKFNSHVSDILHFIVVFLS